MEFSVMTLRTVGTLRRRVNKGQGLIPKHWRRKGDNILSTLYSPWPCLSSESHRRWNSCPCAQAVPQPQLWKEPLCPPWLTSMVKPPALLARDLDDINSPAHHSSSTIPLSNPGTPPVTDTPWEACAQCSSGPSLLLPGCGHLVWLA